MLQVAPSPNKDGSAAPAATPVSSPRIALWSVVICTIIAVVSLIGLWRAQARASRAEFLLSQTDTTDLLRQQQLDELFARQMSLLDPNAQLTDNQRVTLQTWFRYDQRFIEDHENDPTRKYERAIAHARSGKVDALLGNPQRGSLHLRASIMLLKELMVENPRTVGYHDELAAAYQVLGETLAAAGDESAGDAFENAIRLLSDSRLPENEGRAQRLEQSRRGLAEWQTRQSVHAAPIPQNDTIARP